MNRHDKSFDNLDTLFAAARDSEGYLPDNGFSDKVINGLPDADGAGLSQWKKNALILSSAVLGSAIAASITPVFSLPVDELVAALFSTELGMGSLLAVGTGLLGLSGIALWANHKELI